MKNTITNLEAQIDTIQKQIRPLEIALAILDVKLTKERNKLSKSYIDTLPSHINEFNQSQIEWLLQHGDTETQTDYDFKRDFFTKIGVFTCGLNGNTNQYRFALSHTLLPGFIEMYSIIKKYIKTNKSFDNHEVITCDTHLRLYGFYETDLKIEIDPITDLYRVIHRKYCDIYEVIGKWEEFSELKRFYNLIKDVDFEPSFDDRD